MWKQVFINGNPTKYECSSDGKVKNIETGKMLKGKNHNGYVEYELYVDKIGVFITAHRLVATLFLDNPNNLPQVNHKDGNKQNNNVDNLEWCTCQYNNSHAWNTGLNNNTSVAVKVKQFTLDEKFIKEYNSITEAKRETGIAKVREAALGQRKSAGGYIWKISNPEEHHIRDMGRKKKVGQFTLQGDLIEKYSSGAEASRETGINRRGIGDCCIGKIKTSGGYIWRFVE